MSSPEQILELKKKPQQHFRATLFIAHLLLPSVVVECFPIFSLFTQKLPNLRMISGDAFIANVKATHLRAKVGHVLPPSCALCCFKLSFTLRQTHLASSPDSVNLSQHEISHRNDSKSRVQTSLFGLKTEVSSSESDHFQSTRMLESASILASS